MSDQFLNGFVKGLLIAGVISSGVGMILESPYVMAHAFGCLITSALLLRKA